MTESVVPSVEGQCELTIKKAVNFDLVDQEQSKAENTKYFYFVSITDYFIIISEKSKIIGELFIPSYTGFEQFHDSVLFNFFFRVRDSEGYDVVIRPPERLRKRFFSKIRSIDIMIDNLFKSSQKQDSLNKKYDCKIKTEKNKKDVTVQIEANFINIQDKEQDIFIDKIDLSEPDVYVDGFSGFADSDVLSPVYIYSNNHLRQTLDFGDKHLQDAQEFMIQVAKGCARYCDNTHHSLIKNGLEIRNNESETTDLQEELNDTFIETSSIIGINEFHKEPKYNKFPQSMKQKLKKNLKTQLKASKINLEQSKKDLRELHARQRQIHTINEEKTKESNSFEENKQETVQSPDYIPEYNYTTDDYHQYSTDVEEEQQLNTEPKTNQKRSLNYRISSNEDIQKPQLYNNSSTFKPRRLTQSTSSNQLTSYYAPTTKPHAPIDINPPISKKITNSIKEKKLELKFPKSFNLSTDQYQNQQLKPPPPPQNFSRSQSFFANLNQGQTQPKRQPEKILAKPPLPQSRKQDDEKNDQQSSKIKEISFEKTDPKNDYKFYPFDLDDDINEQNQKNEKKIQKEEEKLKVLKMEEDDLEKIRIIVKSYLMIDHRYSYKVQKKEPTLNKDSNVDDSWPVIEYIEEEEMKKTDPVQDRDYSSKARETLKQFIEYFKDPSQDLHLEHFEKLAKLMVEKVLENENNIDFLISQTKINFNSKEDRFIQLSRNLIRNIEKEIKSKNDKNSMILKVVIKNVKRIKNYTIVDLFYQAHNILANQNTKAINYILCYIFEVIYRINLKIPSQIEEFRDQMKGTYFIDEYILEEIIKYLKFNFTDEDSEKNNNQL